MSRVKTNHSLTPYFVDTPGGRVALVRLVGFDPEETKRRGWAWLVRHGFYTEDELGNILRRANSSRRSDEPPEKAEALEKVVDGLTNYEWMWGPERLAGRRWNDALVGIVAALDAFIPYAVVRDQEDGYFAAKVGNRSYDKVYALTREMRELAATLSSKATEARSAITTYKDDPLPGLEAKKPHLNYLATIEARLSLAGFSYPEIAALVPDVGRLDDDKRGRSSARASHLERIRKRVSKVRPEIDRRQKAAALSEASLAAFLKRTGLRGGAAGIYSAWMKSPEGKKVTAQLKAMGAGDAVLSQSQEPRSGK